MQEKQPGGHSNVILSGQYMHNKYNECNGQESSNAAAGFTACYKWNSGYFSTDSSMLYASFDCD